MEKKMLNDEIIDFLKKATSPMTLESIADEFLITQNRAKRALDELRIGGKIIEYIPENKGSARKYYTVSSKKVEYIEKKSVNDTESAATQDTVNSAARAVVQETINVRDDYKDLSEKIEIIDKNVNGIYANIISIMSIFVGIFALITVNANITFKLTQKNMREIFQGIVVVNVFVVICIIVLLIGVRVILISPMVEKKKNNSNSKRG